ncbi:MAG: BACON domain-containing protein [Bacteroidales bacterium]|nr:BACON domain-containing protein [Bacteroidales bacterium]MCL2132942.1 BACON domain-containing protein [Bacteroidales bacterium]
MKYIAIILAGLLSLFAGCDRSNDYTSYEDLLIKVVSSDVVFTAAGGEGSILVDHPTPVLATSSDEWCTLSVYQSTGGQNIVVNVSPHSNLSARSALITITDGNRKNYVTVTQSALHFFIETSRVNIDAEGGEVRLDYECDLDIINVSLSDTWLTCSLDHSQKQVVLDIPSYNNTNVGRSAIATLDIGSGANSFTAKIWIDQQRLILLYEDFVGTYTMTYGDGNNYNLPPNRNSALTVTLVAAGSNIYYVRGILSAADQALGDILMAYNAGNLEWRTHKVFVRTSTQDLIWGAYSQPVGTSLYFNSYTTGSVGQFGTVGMVSTEFEMSPSGELQSFTFIDDGAWTYPVAGFKLRNYTGSTNNGDVVGMNGKTPSSYYFPKFTKQ